MAAETEPIHIGSRYQVANRGALTTIDANTVDQLKVTLNELGMTISLAAVMAQLLIGGEPIIALAGWEVRLLGTVMFHPVPQTAAYTSKPAGTGGRRSRKARAGAGQPKVPQANMIRPKEAKEKKTVAPERTVRTDMQDTPLFQAMGLEDPGQH